MTIEQLPFPEIGKKTKFTTTELTMLNDIESSDTTTVPPGVILELFTYPDYGVVKLPYKDCNDRQFYRY